MGMVGKLTGTGDQIESMDGVTDNLLIAGDGLAYMTDFELIHRRSSQRRNHGSHCCRPGQPSRDLISKSFGFLSNNQESQLLLCFMRLCHDLPVSNLQLKLVYGEKDFHTE